MFVARAPGKLVALGEYAVLDGAPAVVLAVDRYVEAAVGPSEDGSCRLMVRASEIVERRFAPDAPSGAPLVDLVRPQSRCGRAGTASCGPHRATSPVPGR